MKTAIFVILLLSIFALDCLTQSNIINNTKDLLPILENLKSPFDTSIHSYYERYVFVSQSLPQSGQDIKYVWSKNESYKDGDTLETYLVVNNNLIKVFDNEGLVLTITVSKFRSTDNLFDGYVTWSDPTWNESNPNIISKQTPEAHIQNTYKYETMKCLAGEFEVFAGWNPQMPAHFINRRNGYKEKRNIHHFKTLKSVSDYDETPLEFWTECGDVDLKKVTGKKY